MTARHDVVVVGAGFSGIAVAVGLMRDGVEDVVVIERREQVGGTWLANTYPGCACDVPGRLYSLSFAPNPHWSRTFARQPEIEAYLVDVVRRWGVEPHLRLGVELNGAAWNDHAQRWHLETSDGPLEARVLVMACGGLSTPMAPDLPGRAGYTGEVVHTGAWPQDLDVTGRRVAVVGTGASAIQVVPAIAPHVEHLTVVQRTAPWIVPRSDRTVPAWLQRAYGRFPLAEKAARGLRYGGRELYALGFTRHPRLLEFAERGARRHLYAQVRDPALRAALTPSYRMGCKRIVPSSDYYPSLLRPNVRLVPAAAERFTPTGIVTADGSEHRVDLVVMATGFDVHHPPTAALTHGRDGRTLSQAWAGSMRAYLGTTVTGFPNLFVMTGPNTGIGHTSLVYMIESQVNYVVDALRTLRRAGLSSVEVRPEVQEQFNREVDEMTQRTVWVSGGCASWYLDTAGRNDTLWPGPTIAFRRRTRRFDVAAYRTVSASPRSASAAVGDPR